MLSALILCKSIGGILGLVAGVSCLMAIRLSRRQQLAIIIAVVLLAVVVLGILSLPSVTDWLLESHPAQATRWFMWQGVLRMIADRPVAGWGTGMFMLHFPDYKPVLPMRYGLLTDITVYPHNEFMLVTVEAGLIALALYVGALFFAIRRHVRAVESEPDASRRILPWAIFAGFAAMSAQGLVSVALRFWAPSALYWTLWGLVLAYPQMDQTEPASETARAGTSAGIRYMRFAATCLIVAAAAWVIVWPGARAEWLMAGGVRNKGMSRHEVAERLSEAARCSRYVPDHCIALRHRLAALQNTDDLDAAIAAGEQLEQTAPGYQFGRRILGRLYLRRADKNLLTDPEQRLEDLKRAAEVLTRAVKQNPFDVEARLSLAEAAHLLSSRNLPFVLEHVRAAVDADPKHARARSILGSLLERKGDLSAALAAQEAALSLCKENQEDLRQIIIKRRDNLRRKLAAEGEAK